MVMGMGMRTVWISLRAINYTDQAFKAAIKNLKKLSDEEKKRAEEQYRNLQVSKSLIMVGMLQAAMGAMMMKSVYDLMSATARGSEYMEKFGTKITEAKTAIADALFTAFKPFLDVMIIILNVISNNAPLNRLIAVLMMLIPIIMMLKGLTMAYTSALEMQSAMTALADIFGEKDALVHMKQAMAVRLHALSVKGLVISMAAAIAGFMITYEVLTKLNNPIASLIVLLGALAVAYWALFVAKSAASLGVGLVAGGIAAGAAMALASQYSGGGGYQLGTRSAPYTGPMMVHKGEVIYNPALGMPTQVGTGMTGGKPTHVDYDIPITIEEVHLKADMDDLDEQVRKSLRKAARKRR